MAIVKGCNQEFRHSARRAYTELLFYGADQAFATRQRCIGNRDPDSGEVTANQVSNRE